MLLWRWLWLVALVESFVREGEVGNLTLHLGVPQTVFIYFLRTLTQVVDLHCCCSSATVS
jgi:hypothetical protein